MNPKLRKISLNLPLTHDVFHKKLYSKWGVPLKNLIAENIIKTWC